MSKLIHVGKTGFGKVFLRSEDGEYRWYKELHGKEEPLPISASTPEEAMRLASREWKLDHFHPLNCGFRFTFPERDEHGMNAFFWEMAASYKAPSGVYFDESRGHHCLVNNASIDALELMRQLDKEGRL